MNSNIGRNSGRSLRDKMEEKGKEEEGQEREEGGRRKRKKCVLANRLLRCDKAPLKLAVSVGWLVGWSVG